MSKAGCDFPFHSTGMEVREDTEWLFDDIPEDGDGPPPGGKRRLIRREGFASRISYKDRPHEPDGGGPLWRPNPQNVMTRNVAIDTNINRYDEPVKTSVWKTEITEPSRWQDMAMVTKESRTVTPAKECDRSEYYIKENVTGRKFARKNDQVRRPGPDRVRPVVTEDAPTDGTGVAVMHGNYLKISGPRIPGVFLELAEEARNIVIVDGQSVNMKNAQLQRTGRTDPVFVAEIVNNCPMLRDSARVATGTSTEVIPNTNQREQSEPVKPGGPTSEF